MMVVMTMKMKRRRRRKTMNRQRLWSLSFYPLVYLISMTWTYFVPHPTSCLRLFSLFFYFPVNSTVNVASRRLIRHGILFSKKNLFGLASIYLV